MTEPGVSPVRRMVLPGVVAAILGVGIPLAAYALLAKGGLDITGAMYIVLVVSLVITVLFALVECVMMARARPTDDEEPDSFPPASALVVSASEPRQGRRARRALDALLHLDYPAPVHVIYVYRGRLPDDVAELAEHHDLLHLHAADGEGAGVGLRSRLRELEGAFTGVFTVSDVPAADSFRRAWQWLLNGSEMVFGRHVVENGDHSLLAQLAAVQIGAPALVSDSAGRSGTYGYSNIYQRAMSGVAEEQVLGLARGAVFDPHVVSWHRAPTSVRGTLWSAVARARAWVRMPLDDLWALVSSTKMPPVSKVAVLDVCLWRPVTVWLSLQLLPLLIFWAVRDWTSGTDTWIIPLVVLLGLYYLEGGLLRAVLSYVISPADIRFRKGWFVRSAILSPVLYRPLQSHGLRTAQVRSLVGGPRAGRRMEAPTEEAELDVEEVSMASEDEEVAEAMPFEEPRLVEVTFPQVEEPAPEPMVLEPLEVPAGEPAEEQVEEPAPEEVEIPEAAAESVAEAPPEEELEPEQPVAGETVEVPIPANAAPDMPPDRLREVAEAALDPSAREPEIIEIAPEPEQLTPGQIEEPPAYAGVSSIPTVSLTSSRSTTEAGENASEGDTPVPNESPPDRAESRPDGTITPFQPRGAQETADQATNAVSDRRRAVEAVNYLRDLVSGLASQLDASEAERQQLRERIRDLEEQRANEIARSQERVRSLEETAQANEAFHKRLLDISAASLSPSDLQSAQELMDQLVQNPDIRVLGMVADQAARLARALHDYAWFRRILEE